MIETFLIAQTVCINIRNTAPGRMTDSRLTDCTHDRLPFDLLPFEPVTVSSRDPLSESRLSESRLSEWPIHLLPFHLQDDWTPDRISEFFLTENPFERMSIWPTETNERVTVWSKIHLTHWPIEQLDQKIFGDMLTQVSFCAKNLILHTLGVFLTKNRLVNRTKPKYALKCPFEHARVPCGPKISNSVIIGAEEHMIAQMKGIDA